MISLRISHSLVFARMLHQEYNFLIPFLNGATDLKDQIFKEVEKLTASLNELWKEF